MSLEATFNDFNDSNMAQLNLEARYFIKKYANLVTIICIHKNNAVITGKLNFITAGHL
jgi:hypothetical protein